MARPRKLKYGIGEIHLCGYSPEEANRIEKGIDMLLSGVSSTKRGNPEDGFKPLIDEFVPLEGSGPKVGDIVELKEDTIEVVDTTTLSCTALDLYQDPKTKEYQVVFIKYNPVSKSAKVVDFRNAGSFRNAGINNFKIELVKEGKI